MFGKPEGKRYFVFIKMEVIKGLDRVGERRAMSALARTSTPIEKDT